MMRIAYYTLPAHLDVALPLIFELSQLVELHVFLQLNPESRIINPMEVPFSGVRYGVQSGDTWLLKLHPGIQKCLIFVKSFNLVTFPGKSSLNPFSWPVAINAIQALKKVKPDLIHFEGASGRIAWGLIGLRGTPLIMTIHDPLSHSGENRIRKSLARRLAFSQVDHFVLHNNFQKPLFCSQYKINKNKVSCVPMGATYLYRNWIDKPITDDGKSVLFFGRLSKYKGLGILYKAAPKVCESISGVQFRIAGRPENGYSLPELPVLPNGGKITIETNYISNDHLAEIFQKATLVVCPYLDATQSAVVLTAYAFGKPVIASSVGGLPEYIDSETGLLVPPGSPEALAKAIIKLLNLFKDKPEVRKFYIQGIENKCSTDLAWDHIAHRTLSIYKKICI